MQQSKSIYLLASSILSPLGMSSNENFKNLLEGNSGIQRIDDRRFFSELIPVSKIDDEIVDEAKKRFQVFSRFDAILMQCIDNLQKLSSIDFSAKEVVILLSTTKGNIELMQANEHDEKLLLTYSASLIQKKVNNPNQVMVVSNACISGLSATIVAKRVLEKGLYHHAVIIGCDVLSNFVISGFNSFHAISKVACKPFDKSRSGITLGEACAAYIVSSKLQSDIWIGGGFIANDANHISGPSKTGEELSYCITESLKGCNISQNEIDFISAHGTATEYNDEMESKAFEHAQLQQVPVFSLKAHYGHTLGASGILETIISAECLRRNVILPSKGFSEKGVSGNICINEKLQHKELKHAIKTASGFGGCNAAIILAKS